MILRKTGVLITMPKLIYFDKYSFPEIKIEKTEEKECKQFGKKVAKTTVGRYKDRNQGYLDKESNDHFIGKLAEMGVYKFCKNLGERCTEPDFNIYQGTRKSFDVDLRINDYKIHVKSQTDYAAKAYGFSWIFQYGGVNGATGHKDGAIFNSKEGAVILCRVDRVNDFKDYSIRICAMPLLKHLHERNLFDFPELEKHKNTKRAVYYEDYKGHLNNIEKHKDISWSFVNYVPKIKSYLMTKI